MVLMWTSNTVVALLSYLKLTCPSK